MTKAGDRLSIKEIVSYGLPMMGINGIAFTLGVYLPNFYTDEIGVSAALLSWIFLSGRIWDALTDPAVGHISDLTRTRWGRRRPYFLISALPIWFLYYLIWVPSPSLSATGAFVYLMICYFMLYTFYTVFYIPHYSLGMEYSPDYHERSRLFGGRLAFHIVGSIMGVVLPPYLSILAGSKKIGYTWMGFGYGALTTVLILITFLLLRERKERIESPRYPFFKGLRVTFRNRAFIILMLTYMITMVAISLIQPLTMYLAKYIIKMEWTVQPLVITYMACSIVSIPIWLSLAKKFGKNKTWSGALVLSACGWLCLLSVGEGTWLRFILCGIPTGTAAGCTLILGPSIQADVIDSDELETGSRREGAFVGVLSFIDKAAIGLAVFVALQGLSMIGYVPNVEQTETVKKGIMFLISYLPAFLSIVAVLIFQMFPITREVHADIRKKLEERKKDLTTAEPTTN